MTAWEAVGKVAPKELTEARLQLHWASQLVAAVGGALVPKQPDDSHTALECIHERSFLASNKTDTTEPRRVALSLPDLRIVVLDSELAEVDALPLPSRTLDDGLDWLSGTLGATLHLPEYEMPAHPIRDGGTFAMDRPEAFDEMALWYRNAARILENFDTTVQCWPHHFDIAILTTVQPEKTIGIGLSPGDGSYDEPYWYVTPWPYPEPGDRPALAKGHWHNEGFVAAILTGSELTQREDREAQGQNVDAFLDSAISGARQLLAG